MRRPPQSATNFAVALAALCAGLGAIWLISPVRWGSLARTVPYIGVIPCLAVVAVVAIAEWLAPRLRGNPGEVSPPPSTPRSLNLRRVGIRLLGWAATLGLVAFAYWLLPEYHGEFYNPYWLFLRTISPLAILVPFYFLWCDVRGDAARDEYLAVGSLLIAWHRRPPASDWPLIRRHLLGWLIKGFFLPLMTVYLANELQSVYNIVAANGAGSMPRYQLFYHLSYAVDLLFCVVGYSVALRLFDSHIRSVEPTLLGWLVALLCYQPFYSSIGQAYLQYDDEIYWDNWLQAWPTLRDCWAVAIVALLSIYALATVSFGLRFSNLTHRGIITSGPYRFTKHPAYVSKNLSWWLISVPFVSSQGWGEALRNCGLLLLLNLVYYIRARTEERHLSADPAYVAYALWMNERGWLRPLARLIPLLRYRPPKPAT